MKKNLDDLNKYTKGRPCPQGHTERYKSTGDCVICTRAGIRKYREKKKRNKERREKRKKDRKQETRLIDFQNSVTVFGNPNRKI
ncbi:hypothetical protein [Xenorhabdus sp. Sc-CR9]|uniref:hypothetical protein n=1 Tax=Xenorhabdus sp. Sc-CR9 TaxID=2584468 RepID=UPI001F3BCA5D|nr:hypothetical protein [Xenorhabdus sp. Sc-CR9]